MKSDWGEEDVEEKEGLVRLSMGGLVVGMIATVWFTRVLAGFLYDVEPNDPATLLMVGAVLILVSAAACLAPAGERRRSIP